MMVKPWSTMPITHAQHIRWLGCGAKMPRQATWWGKEWHYYTDTCRLQPHEKPWHQGDSWVWAAVEYVYGSRKTASCYGGD